MNNAYKDIINQINWQKVNGLIPAIVQDSTSFEVLMLGYMNHEAIKQTLQTQKVTFFSRTKQRLWCKGETSGHVLHFKAMSLDCDGDTLLIQAIAKGPVCHKNTPTCFDTPKLKRHDLAFLSELEQIIASRKNAPKDDSYTASLYAKGTKRIAQKVAEEGVEVALAAMARDKEELINESADLIYHLLVILQDQNLCLNDVINKLHQRHHKGK